MFIGRKDELRQLEAVYVTDHSNLIVLYGREGIGKTTLALKFCENRNYLYYRVNDFGPADKVRFIERIRSDVQNRKDDGSKLVIILDEFQLLATDEYDRLIIDAVRTSEPQRSYMFLMLSSSINWVENKMVAEHKEIARLITGIIKLRGMSFVEMVDWFPKATVEDCIMIRAILGGVPKYLTLWQDNRRARENICNLFFSENSPFKNEAEYQLKIELRELGAYNSILTCLASGMYKLNDIYAYTGFSRAKISVYLKNLIEMDIVEKMYSVSVKNSENTKKGLYRIKDSFIAFYYGFVFPNLSDIESGRGRDVYYNCFVPKQNEFMRNCFSDVCREYLEIMSKFKKLGFRYSDWSAWFGKKGTIDIVGDDGQRHILTAVCYFEDRPVSKKMLDSYDELITDSGLKVTKKCIFSRSGFTDEALKLAGAQGIMTVPMSEM